MKFAFIGDSYSAGYLLPDATKRWSTNLCVKAKATEVNVAKSGSGFCFRGAGATFVEQAQQIVDLQTDFEAIFVTGGHNDSVSDLPLATIESQIWETFRILRENCANTKIYVATWWHYLQPTDRILAVDSIMTRVGAKFGAVEIPNSVWWRVGRREWSFDDGHPNEAGGNLMGTLVYSQLYQQDEGMEEYGRFVRNIQQDCSFVGAANVAEGTIYNARPGLWRLEARGTFYGPAGGWNYVASDGVSISQRSDLTGTPMPLTRSEQVVHLGGDMRIAFGYSAAWGNPTVIGSGSAVVEATFIS